MSRSILRAGLALALLAACGQASAGGFETICDPTGQFCMTPRTADGALPTYSLDIGTTADAAYSSSNGSASGSVVAILKGLYVSSLLPASIKYNPTTPTAGTAYKVTTGGTAVTMVTGPVQGCFITNPTSATDEGIATAENAYVNPVTTATTTGNNTTVTLAPGQTYYCVPGQTTSVSVNAATSSHSLSVAQW